MVSPEAVEQAREMDLVTYLRYYEPNELVHLWGDTYTTRTHDSLKISNGKWMWWSRGIGGCTALDYLIKVKEMQFCDAVELIAGEEHRVNYEKPKRNPSKPKLLLLPEKSKDANVVTEYLFGRGIDFEIINECLHQGIIFESLPYHNVVFVGNDEAGKARYAAYRATNKTRIMGDASGSDKHYSFRLTGYDDTAVHIFESAIDALSYATLMKMQCKDWRKFTLISLAGVYAPHAKTGDSKLPAALAEFLKLHPNTRKVVMHLDNDQAGRMATEVIKNKLTDVYEVVDEPAPKGKDINDFLRIKLGLMKEKERSYER